MATFTDLGSKIITDGDTNKDKRILNKIWSLSIIFLETLSRVSD